MDNTDNAETAIHMEEAETKHGTTANGDVDKNSKMNIYLLAGTTYADFANESEQSANEEAEQAGLDEFLLSSTNSEDNDSVFITPAVSANASDSDDMPAATLRRSKRGKTDADPAVELDRKGRVNYQDLMFLQLEVAG